MKKHIEPKPAGHTVTHCSVVQNMGVNEHTRAAVEALARAVEANANAIQRIADALQPPKNSVGMNIDFGDS